MGLDISTFGPFHMQSFCLCGWWVKCIRFDASVRAAHLEARPLVLAVLVRNGRGQVTSQEQGDQWNSSNLLVLAAGATHRQGVGRGSYHLVTPARSIGPLMGSFSSSKVLKKTRW